jgi:hypothetical protein
MDFGHGHFIVLGGFVAIAVILAVYGIARKKGVAVDSFKFVLPVTIISCAIFIIIPILLFADIPIKARINIVIFASAFSSVYFAILYKIMQRKKKQSRTTIAPTIRSK